jgi:ATP-dependent DNA helicase RecQ
MREPVEFLELAEKEVFSRLKKATRPRQQEVLAALSLGENVFASLPTGYGKSLCYWAPAAAWGWKVWVISPLISLIQDQAMACEALGLKVAAWHAGLGAADKDELLGRMERGEAQITFLSPERLLAWWRSGVVERLGRLGQGPDLIALDEMHCFEEWRSFREGYLEAFAPVRRLSERGVRLLGLSASLARAEADAWMSELCESHRFVGAGLGRENLTLLVKPIDTEGERWLWLASALRSLGAGDCALVYCATRAECDEVSRWLKSAGFPACAYHAGLPQALRAARSRSFRAGALPIICATTAFGMGVDYPRVRRVIHFSLPHSLEAYWQEAGRAGRDGEPAFALALWRRSEIMRAVNMGSVEKEKFFSLWSAWASGNCRKRAVGERFGMTEKNCGRCDRCLAGEASLPEWMRSDSISTADPWWVRPEARLQDWSKEKIFNRQA